MKMYVNTSNNGALNLRDGPSFSNPTVAKIPNGTALEVEQINDDWGKTTYNNKVGYVSMKYLTPNEALRKIYESLKETLKLIEEVL